MGDGSPVGRGRAAIRAGGLLLFIAGALAAMRLTPVLDYLTPEALRRGLDGFGPWGPLLFVLLYAAGVCLFIPGTLLTGLGAALFGPWWGFVYVWCGAMLGASGAFWIGRSLGRDFAAAVIGERLIKYDQALERNGLATVLYLRLVYFPFTAMNFGMGLTRVRFGDYLLGTGLGILVGTFVFTFFIGTLEKVWASGAWEELLSGRVLFSLALFVGSFFIPRLVRRIRS